MVFFVRLLVAVLLIGAATRSWSQTMTDSPERYRHDVAGARPQPAYDPLGARIGGLIAHANGDFGIGYNSNIFSRASEPVGDSFSRISPSLRLSSDWGRHAVSISGNAVFTRFFHQRDQDSDEYQVQAAGNAALGDSSSISPLVEYAREAEPRGSTGNRLTAGEPVYMRRFSASIGARYVGPAITAETLFVFRELRYEPVTIDGVSLSQGFRASNGFGGRGTLVYKATPSASLLVQLVGDVTRNPHHEFCCLRNAHGYALLGGIRLDNSGMIVGQAAIGYRQRYFEGSKTSSHGLTYDARIEWYPTALMTVTLTAEQQFRNSGIAAANTALVGTQSLSLDYELLRNLIVNVQGEHESDSYRRIDAHSDLKTLSFSATYTPRRMVQCVASAKFRFNDTNRQAVVSSFNGFQGSLMLRFRL